MYPRNQAAPERISIGAVVKIADGEVQESDVLIRVLAQGEDPAVGEGTVGYQDGIIHYTPTQAETDHTSIIFIAHKADCYSAEKTVVTTVLDAAGVPVAGVESIAGSEQAAKNLATRETGVVIE